MNIYPKLERSITTRKAKQEVKTLLASRAEFIGDQFSIVTEPRMPLSRTKVEGKVTELNELTIIDIEILPSDFSRVFNIAWLSGCVILLAVSLLWVWLDGNMYP